MIKISRIQELVTMCAKKQDLPGKVISISEDDKGYVATYGSMDTPYGNVTFSVDIGISRCTIFQLAEVDNLIRYKKMKKIYSV